MVQRKADNDTCGHVSELLAKCINQGALDIVVACYTEEQGTPFWTVTMEQKFAASLGTIEKLHPGHGKELKNPIYCGWRHVK